MAGSANAINNEAALGSTRETEPEPERRAPLATLGNTATIVSSVATVGVQAPKAIGNAPQAFSVAEQLQLLSINTTKSQSNFSVLLGDILSGGRIRIGNVSQKSEALTELQQRESQTLLSTLSVQTKMQVTGAAASTGLVVWALNSGGLLSSVMATVPVWSSIDPISILDQSNIESQRTEDEDEQADEEAAAEMLS